MLYIGVAYLRSHVVAFSYSLIRLSAARFASPREYSSACARWAIVKRSVGTANMDGDSEQTKRFCFGMCQQYFGKAWKATPFYEHLVKKVSGGLSNYLFVCSLPDDAPAAGSQDEEPRQVLVRFYGLASGDPVAVLQDSLVFALLSEKGLGPKFYGFFSGGRFEQYIPSRCLKTAELSVPERSKTIAEKMANLHLLDMPLCKEPKMLKERMMRWLKAAPTSCASFKDARKEALWKRLMNAVDLEAELRLLMHILDTSGLPIVFCHNDLQEGNILIADNNPDLVLIDFEYAAYNFRGFDLANHFCEWCYDYTYDKPPYFKADLASYPTMEQQAFYIKHYLRALLAGQQQSSRSDGEGGSHGCGSDGEGDGHNSSPSAESPVIAITDKLLEEKVAGVMRESDVCVLASHFHWMLWALVSATTSQIDFGYLEYAQARLDGYYASKENLLKKYPDIRERLVGNANVDLTFQARSRSASEEERQEG